MGRGTDNNPDAMTTRVDDKKFVKDAAIGGLTEVELGKLAAQKGSSDAVKQFGQKLVDDHTKANDELKQVASAENIQAGRGVRSDRRILIAFPMLPTYLKKNGSKLDP